MIKEAVAELGRGGLVLLFPEGTRTTRAPLNRLTGSAGVIASHARVPDPGRSSSRPTRRYLSKGWTIFRVPDLPISYRVRLGRRLEPADDAAAFTQALEGEFARELAGAPQNRWLGETARSRTCNHAAGPHDPAHPAPTWC